MANWPTNPDWTPVDLINGGVEITTADGFLASDQNKIVSNIIYLFNHLSSQHVQVGNVSTTTGDPGTQASVKITGRYVDGTGDGDPELYLDFEFTIPQGAQGAQGPTGSFGTPSATVTTLAPDAEATVAIEASGPDTAKIFAFTFGIPQGKQGEMGPPGPGVAAGMSPQIITLDMWTGDTAPYTITIPASKHGLGETPYLVCITLPGSSTEGYEETYDSPKISANGTVTITSNVKWEGNILLCGGISEAVDAAARSEIDNIIDGTTIVKKAEQDKLGNDIADTYTPRTFLESLYLSRTGALTATLQPEKPTVATTNYLATTTTNTSLDFNSATKLTLTRTLENNIKLNNSNSLRVTLAFATNRNASIEFGARVKIGDTYISSNQAFGLSSVNGDAGFTNVNEASFNIVFDNIIGLQEYAAGQILTVEIFTRQSSGQSLNTRYFCGVNVSGADRNSFAGITLVSSTITTSQIADGAVTKPKLSSDVQASLNKADTALQTNVICTGTTGTAATEAIKIVNIAVGKFELVAGVTLNVLFDNGNTASGNISLNVNGTGAKPVVTSNGIAATMEDLGQPIIEQSVATFLYDGTNWRLLNAIFLDKPVGIVYTSFVEKSPANIYGGNWERLEDKFLYAVSTSDAGDTGGLASVKLEKKHIPLLDEMFAVKTTGMGGVEPTQTAGALVCDVTWAELQYTDGANRIKDLRKLWEPDGYGKPHENMPPYIKVYAWRRLP